MENYNKLSYTAITISIFLILYFFFKDPTQVNWTYIIILLIILWLYPLLKDIIKSIIKWHIDEKFWWIIKDTFEKEIKESKIIQQIEEKIEWTEYNIIDTISELNDTNKNIKTKEIDWYYYENQTDLLKQIIFKNIDNWDEFNFEKIYNLAWTSFEKAYPKNKYIKSKIYQQLQVLSIKWYIEFMEWNRGNYKLIKKD